jgi:hypothetical protein
MLKTAVPAAYLVVFGHACQQVRSQHLDDMFSSMQGRAVLERVLYSDGLGWTLVLHWRRVLHNSKSENDNNKQIARFG